MKASAGFGLGGHDRFRIPFVPGAITFVYCDVGNNIIRLSKRSCASRTGQQNFVDPTYLSRSPVRFSANASGQVERSVSPPRPGIPAIHATLSHTQESAPALFPTVRSRKDLDRI